MRLYPARFRRAHGLAMFELFRDEARAAQARSGAKGVFGLLSASALDTARSAPAAWLTPSTKSAYGARWTPDISGISGDVRLALRHLRQSPAFTLVAVATLALGIGANTAMFSVVNAFLLRPVSARGPDRVVRIAAHAATGGAGARRFSYAEFVDFRDRATTLSELAAVNLATCVLTADNRTDQLLGEIASGGYLSLLGAHAEQGRLLAPSDDKPGAAPVAVISNSLWRRRFGGEAIVGRHVLLNRTDYTVVGIADEAVVGSFVGAPVDVWLPIQSSGDALGPNWRTDRSARTLALIGRLADGASRTQARSELQIVESAAAPDASSDLHRSVDVEPGMLATADQRRSAGAFLAVLSTLVLLVLLVACANVGNLLLSRVIGRKRELAIRLSLGASRARVARMLATEALVIGASAGAGALLLSIWITRALERINLLPGLTLRLPAEVDAHVLTFTAAAALFASLALAAVGTLQVVRRDLAPALKDNGPAAMAGGGRTRVRGALVGVQITVSLLLVIGAALFVRGARAAAAMDPGFDPRGVVVLDLDATTGRSVAESLRLFRAALQQLGDMPTVVAAALSTRAPLDSSTPLVRVSARVPVEAGDQDSPTVTYLVVSSRFFEVVKTPVASGRPFTDADDATRTPVAIVNESLAARLWPNGDALGRRLWLESQVSTTPCVVVGVARDSKYLSLADERQGHVYLPFAQHPRRGMALLVRSIDPPERAIRDVRNLLHAVDPGLEGFFARTLVEHVAVSTLPVRLAARLAAAIAGLALALAVVGLYSLVSFLVIDRTHELGLRMALGATAGDVMRLVIAYGLRLTLAGLTVGLPTAIAGTRLLRTLLYGVSPVDPVTFVAASAAVVTVATLACALPAWRAMRLSPIVALRRP